MNSQEILQEAPAILIVEDDQSSAALLKEMLGKSGYKTIDIAESGEEALKRILIKKPEIILMDIALKGAIDGIETAEKIHNSYQIPVIYITGGSDDATFERAKKTMPYGYILKPYQMDLVISNIEMAFYRFNMERKLRESERRNREILSSIPDVMFKLDGNGNLIAAEDHEKTKKVWPGKITEKVMPVIKRALNDETTQIFEYSLRRSGDLEHYEARILKTADNTLLVIVRDVTDKKNAEIELFKYKNDLENIIKNRTEELAGANKNLNIFNQMINQSPNSIILTDNKGIVQYANLKFIEMSGYGFDELKGVDVTKCPNPVFPEEEFWDMISSVENWRGEIYSLSKEGQIYYSMTDVSKIRDDDGKVTHYRIVCQDITEKMKEKIEIDRVRDTLEKRDVTVMDMELDWKEWKEKMLSRNVSRTDKSLFRNINNSFTQGAGLGSMITLLEMLSSAAVKKENKYLVDGNIFDLIMENVLTAQEAFKTFASLDWIISHEFELERVSFRELHGFVKAVADKARELCSIRKQKIIINQLDFSYSNLFINMNQEYLYKAVYEVLINAMKFSKIGSIIVVLVHISNMKALISVTSDPDKTGEDITGIPIEYEKVIFEPFYRLSKNVFEQYKTLDFGLGLTLVEKIVTKHGGEVYAGNVVDHSDLKRDPVIKVNTSISLPIVK